MAAQIKTVRNVVIENVTQIPKSAAKVAAAFLVLQPYPYSPAVDFHRAKQAIYFQEPEVQIQPWKGSLVVVTNQVAISPAIDKRIKQAQFFQEPETQLAPQKGFLLATLSTYAQVAQSVYKVKYVSAENVSQISAWKSYLNTLVFVPPAVQSADIFNGHDTQGWPLETYEPPTFYWPWKNNELITNNVVSYNVAADRRSKQALYYPEVEFTVQPWRSNVVVLNTFPVYNPAIDRRAKQSLFFPEPESYLRQAPFNAVIINGTVPGFVAPSIPPTISVWTADATGITADTINFTWDGADLINGGASGTPTTVTQGGIAYTVSQILRF